MSGLTSSTLGPEYGFNWIFLVEVLVCGILASFFLFYFNRLVATVISYAIRAWTWHKYRAYVDITALQFSLLGGRIFFKSIRYHAQNVTVLVHDGHITWRYWLGQVQDAEIFEVEDPTGKGKARSASRSRSRSRSSLNEKSRGASVDKAEKGGSKPKKELPCRISVRVSGVEAFIYNRSPVYDAIVEAALRKSKGPTKSASTGNGHANENSSPSSSDGDNEKQRSAFSIPVLRADTNNTTGTGVYKKPNVPAWLHMLPVKIECKRAAAALGNQHTTSIIVAKLERAVGTLDAGHAGPLDIFKLLFNFEFEKVNVAMKPNRDFKLLQLDYAKQVLTSQETEPLANNIPSTGFRRSLHAFFKRRGSAGGSVRAASPESAVNNGSDTQRDIPGQSEWHGLTRYLEDEEVERSDEWEHVEYAKSSTLVDCPRVSFRFYWDIPGEVQRGPTDGEELLGTGYEDDMNGSKPPDYGLDFGVHGGYVVYGPWADRERANIQQIFVPGTYTDGVPSERLQPGELRVSTVFKIFVSVEEEITLRVPTREGSKNEQWQGRADQADVNKEGDENQKQHGKHRRKHKHHRRHKRKQGTPGVDARPYGWLDITVKADTTVNYRMDMFARASGYKNFLDLDVKGTEMTSSVNHGLLWRAGALTLDADLSYPLGWSHLRKWPFNIVCDDLELFILRDHMFLITDIVNDWSSGPPPDFWTFVPFFYTIDMTFRNFTLYLNVNDANIVNDPSDLDKNDFLTMEGRKLHGVLGISLEHYRPRRNELTFDVLAEEMKMRMLSPARSTLQTLLKDKLVAEMPKLTLKGSFDANGETQPGLTDVLRLDLVGSGLNLTAYGFLVRQLIGLKENYFGDYLHFKTLEEFQGAAGEDVEKANAKTATSAPPQTANELDVILCIIAEDVTLLFPTNIYSCDEFIRADVAVANLDLRVVSYYLDMGLDLSPISFTSGRTVTQNHASRNDSMSSTQMVVRHLNLNGHRAFGAPPVEPAYVNNWDIDVGAITGELSTEFFHRLVLAGQGFAFSMQDGENILPIESPNIFDDITFAQVKTDILRLWLHIGKHAMLLSAQPIGVTVSDWANETFSQRITVMAPQLTLACVDPTAIAREHMAEGHIVSARTIMFLQTGLSVTVLGRKANFASERQKQQAHVRQTDLRTGRAAFLQLGNDYLPPGYVDINDFDAPAMIYPVFPAPLNRSHGLAGQSRSVRSSGSSLSDRKLRGAASSSSLASSIRPSRSANREPSAGSISQSNTASVATPQQPSSRGRISIGLKTGSSGLASSFSEPHFPLNSIEPDETAVPQFSVLSDDTSSSDASSHSRDGDTPSLRDDAAQTSVIIQVEPGVRAYVEPGLATAVLELVRGALPHRPDEVMDSFQMRVMNSIVSRQQINHGETNTLEIHASVPSIHIRVAATDETTDIIDIVDIKIQALQQIARIRTGPSASGAQQHVALHTLIESIRVAVSQHHDGRVTEDSVAVAVDDVLVWVALAETRSVHAQVRDASATLKGDHAQQLARAVLRLLPVVVDIVERFEELTDNDRRRLLLLIHTLTQHSDGLSDPPFLSRMTYILRAFPSHFRNQDSWKVLARFRYILQALPIDVTESLRARYSVNDLQCPPDATRQVLDSWAQWRNWDVPNVSDTLTFRTLYSEAEARPMEPAVDLPTTLTVRSERLTVALSHGKKASEIGLQEASLGVDITPPKAPTGLMLMEEHTRKQTLLQVHTSSIEFAFDWSLFSIAEGILPLVQQFQAFTLRQTGRNEHRSARHAIEDGLDRHDMHIVLSTDSGTVNVQSINLRHASSTENLKMSLLATNQGGDRLDLTGSDRRYGQCTSAIINADTAITELHGPSSCIWQTLLTSPSVYIDHLEPAVGSKTAPSVVVAIAYDHLEIAVKDQLPGILSAIDSIIVDEVSKVMQLVRSAETNMPAVPAFAPHEDPIPSAPNATFSIAVLAGSLNLEISLLQALDYRLEGKTGSFRITPSLSRERSFVVDFDVGQQSHSFINHTRTETHRQGLLELPPINGHVDMDMGPDETSLSVAATIDKIEVDAAAISGVAAVMNKAEVKDVLDAVKHSVDDIKRRVDGLEMSKTVSKPAAKLSAPKPIGRRLIYDVRFALLGLRISASTPQITGRSTAEIELGVGPLHATASNRGTTTIGNPLIPEIRAQIQDIGARLWVLDHGQHVPRGKASFGLKLRFTSQSIKDSAMTRELTVQSDGLEVNAYPETASTAVDVINHLQDRIRDLDLSREVEYLRKLRDRRREHVMRRMKEKQSDADEEPAFSAVDLLSIKTIIQLANIRINWLVAQRFSTVRGFKPQDAVFTLAKIELATHGSNEARLTILDMMLQLAHRDDVNKKRSLNSALLPEVAFSVAYWSKGKNISLAFKATGKPLDLRLETKFMLPVSAVQLSIEYALDMFRKGTATWQSTPTKSGAPRKKAFDTKRIASLLVEADFAGAQVYLEGSGGNSSTLGALAASSHEPGSSHGRYGQFAAEGALKHTTLKAPGIALKLEYNSHDRQPTVNGELRIDASKNVLLPNVVPLILEISDTVKEVVQNADKPAAKTTPPADSKGTQRFFEDENIVNANPSAIFGRTKVDLGLRVCRQEFGLTCQPIARVDAKAVLEDFYLTINTIESSDYGHFFALSATLTGLSAQIKHVYSREPTFGFEIESIVLSVMNNKHLNGVSGVSAVLKVNPARLAINGKQLQDLLLFREIWVPPEIRSQQAPVAMESSSKSDDFLVERYHVVAAAAAFPWNATVSIAKLTVDLDLGQSIGKTSFVMGDLWASQQKTSNLEQNLCLGLDSVDMTGTGRMSGFIQLSKLGVRTSINWSEDPKAQHSTPLIQASIGFQRLRAKAAFDYQAFAFGDIEGFDFLMYNAREGDMKSSHRDRLVAVLDCQKAFVFCTSTSPAQALGLFQAFDRLIQEKQAAYMESLRDIEKHVRKESTVVATRFGPIIPGSPVKTRSDELRSPISLHTDVILTLGEVSFGVYPSTFLDSQILKLEANTVQARFAVGLERGKIHSGLGMTIGQLQVALASTKRLTVVPKALDITVDEVISSATNAKGGTILKVPRVVASMQTWQAPHSNEVDYIFKSLFEGKIDVGWNLSRINFIKGMWNTHSRALASRLGKALPESAVRIRAASESFDKRDGKDAEAQEKITAEVHLPQSKYEYTPLEPPIIETPQLRDMGEATPPLEWIGLQRDKLPNVTHQIIIVSLLEVAKEVEDAYERILGSS